MKHTIVSANEIPSTQFTKTLSHKQQQILRSIMYFLTLPIRSQETKLETFFANSRFYRNLKCLILDIFMGIHKK